MVAHVLAICPICREVGRNRQKQILLQNPVAAIPKAGLETTAVSE